MASSMMKQAIVYVFLISTIYGLVYYYNIGASNDVSIEGLGDSDGSIQIGLEEDDSFASLILNAVDSLLEFISWLSLFSIVKGIFYTMLPASIYAPVNLFLLRPTGWITAAITTEWMLNKVRGTSEG